MIEITHIAKVFGLRPVLRSVDLTIPAGGFLALFGPNGAGKTTLLRIVATLSQPTAGDVTINGLSTTEYAAAIRGILGIVSHQLLLYGDLTAQENLQFYARMYGLNKDEEAARVNETLEAVGLIKRRDDLVRTFSRGMKQRLTIARAILHEPAVLLLDEPYTGLDQQAANTLNTVLTEVATQGRTVLMTTHNIARGLEMADHVAILTKGKIGYHEATAGLTPLAFSEVYADITGMATVR